MEHYFYNNDPLNDVKRLKAKTKQFDRQTVEWRKILEEKAITNSYKCLLRRIWDKANKTNGHPKRKRDNVTIVDPQYRLFLGELNDHAIAYAIETENENGVPAYIRYEAKHGSKGELGHEESRRKTKHCVERFDSQHVGRAQRVEKDKGKFVDRDDHKAQSSRKRAHCDADVEILDDDVFHKKLSPFVHSKPFQKCIEVDDVDFGSTTSANDVFREKLVDVLKKPFDKDELKRLGDDVRNGLYYVHYPDLQRKLIKYRYKQGKRLNILRGFLFWLLNVCQQGSFKPWKDRRCIAVEPGPPETSPPPRSANPNCAKQSKRKILK